MSQSGQDAERVDKTRLDERIVPVRRAVVASAIVPPRLLARGPYGRLGVPRRGPRWRILWMGSRHDGRSSISVEYTLVISRGRCQMPDLRSRPYHSPIRQQQADETRRRILDAARRLLLERGYDGTTIESV